MVSEMEKRIEGTVRKILEGANVYELNELGDRELASKDLGIYLSREDYKLVVRRVVESFVADRIAGVEARKAERLEAEAELMEKLRAHNAGARAKSNVKAEEEDVDEEEGSVDEDKAAVKSEAKESDEEDSE